MSAHSNEFPWPSYYGHFDYFEQRMAKHNRVQSLTRTSSPGTYVLKRTNGPDIRLFICECYLFGVAEYHEVVANLGRVDAVIIASLWCKYTGQVQDRCRDQDVGVFTIAEFMGAINRREIWTYVGPEE